MNILGTSSETILQDKGSVPECIVIDENTPGNVLSDSNRGILLSDGILNTLSTEGFAHNIEKQKQIGDFLQNTFNIKDRGDFLDVGFGTNIYVSERFKELGIEPYAVDPMQYKKEKGEEIFSSPKLQEVSENGVRIFSGDIADINKKDSSLKDNRFGFILFDGSWESNGNNWTVAGEILEAKYHEKGGSEKFSEFRNKEKTEILKTCKDKLSSNGLLGIISSRYAYHGGGYRFSEYPDEKQSFLDLYSRFIKLGAKKVYVIGLTQKGLDNVLMHSHGSEEAEDQVIKFSRDLKKEEIDTIRDQLRAIDMLPIENVYTKYSNNREYEIKKIKEVVDEFKKSPKLDNIARIDAIFAEF